MIRFFLVTFFATVALVAGVTRAAETFKIDPVHSMVIFRIAHLDIGNIYGRFNEPTGTVVWDPADPGKSTFNLEIAADKIDTANEKRDQHLKSPDFFDARQFPTITFKSTGVKATGQNKFDVTGDLNLHGVTKSITVTVTKTGEGPTQMGYRTGWEGTVDLKRSDYGIKGVPGVGDDVHLIVAFEAVKQ